MKKSVKIIVGGYVGALISTSVIGSFAYHYQYIYSYSSYANVYELGNAAVAMDTLSQGRIPIIDYFSAHALDDVWTRMIYSFIHNDIKGILADPYSGLKTILCYLILFYMLKKLFDKNIAMMYTLLFPGNVSGIIWTSVCFISIVALLYIYKQQTWKSYFIFWGTLLLSAFYVYDQGISIGVACILAYVIISMIKKEWYIVRRFVISGISVAAFALVVYIVYGLATDIPLISRIREWISVSLGSSSTWATATFGNQSTFAFLLCYFVVPLTVVLILIRSIMRYIRCKTNEKYVLIIIVFALAELLYIPRTIVFHNLAICSGRTGVLLNFIHWTVALYVLYILLEKQAKTHLKILGFAGTMFLVILLENTAVLQAGWQGTDSTLLSKGIKASQGWNLQDGMTENIGKERIVYDEDTTTMLQSFTTIFDVLLKKEETFLDFANMSGLYVLTERQRPCYVGQSPSLLTDLYSQECFLEEISQYDCPLVIWGTSETPYLTSMIEVPHNIRYYKIAEYIYSTYRPLVKFGEFAIWCDLEEYERYKEILSNVELDMEIYELIDYGYDFTTSYQDENNSIQYSFRPYHSYNLGMIPYIWANADEYGAIDNKEIISLNSVGRLYSFEGSQSVLCEEGNYLLLEVVNVSEEKVSSTVELHDALNLGAKMKYSFDVLPGTNQYLIRISVDYFWQIYNINKIKFEKNEYLKVQNICILEGD
jgi:hypothetical protein